ncbi:MAG: tyrosine-type recombinase/integrase, partial [Campylobacterota bacterium]|nr:tyrosine-type recombinase/integrase [Campylobacterota bacterium]
MTNLFKRNKTYYIRLSINDNLKIYFNNKPTYIRSLQTHNVNNAKVICRYLVAQFNYIKKSTSMFTTKEIKDYIDEFKEINYTDIINRNTHLSINQINTNIETLSEDVDMHDELIQKEFYDLMNIIDLSGKKEDAIRYGIDVNSAKKFKNQIVQIKINALNDVKKSIQSKVNISHINQAAPMPIKEDGVTIKTAMEEFLNSRSSLSKAVVKTSTKRVEEFEQWCQIHNLKYIDKLKHKDLIAYRDYLHKINNKVKRDTINTTLTDTITFINYCTDTLNYIGQKITNKVKFKLTTKEKLSSKRDSFTNEDIKKILDNIDLIKHSSKTNKLNKYANEYEIIIKIAMYTGARENEICQLTKNDIKVDNGINYINFTIDLNSDEKDLKTISSIRKIPIHSDLLPQLQAYIKTIKGNKLFTIKATKMSIDFGYFKTKLEFGSTYVFHSFRHTFQNKLKQLDIEFEKINELVG